MEERLKIYELAEQFAEQTDCSLFITGKAGTGKTTFLREIRARNNKQIAVVAPTGIAAINAGGTTMHSFFQLPFTPFIPTPEGRKNLIEKQQMRSMKRKLLREVETIVIDEVSMVRADVMDAVDTILRYYRYRPNEPFGGVQMIFIGDLYQLSPVAQFEEWELLGRYYRSPYFFHSKVIQESPPLYVEFDKIFRQTNQHFINLLNEVRNNKLSYESMVLLQSRYQPNFKPDKEDFFITLCTHNYKADAINAEELEKIEADTFSFNAKIVGDFPERNYPNDYTLELKVGAKVMFIANDHETPRRFYNGKLGEVVELDEESIVVRTEEGESIQVGLDVWKNVSYRVDTDTNQIVEEELGTFSQYPLRLAWAITIHKSQGLTFDRAIIDAGASFAPGQVYVALSRCRTLEGIVLLSPINPNSLGVDKEVRFFADAKPSVDELVEQLQQSRHNYQRVILHSIFDFKANAGEIGRIVQFVKDNEGFFDAEAIRFMEYLHTTMNEIEAVANRFSGQIDDLFKLDSHARLRERVGAASEYFGAQLELLLNNLDSLPIVTDSRQAANVLDGDLKEAYINLTLRLKLIEGCRSDYSVTNYYAIKNQFKAPAYSLSCYAGRKKSPALVKVEHIELYKQLLDLRNTICEAHDLPVFLVASGKSLQDMCKQLPVTERELMNISGFGKEKSRRYGHRFIEIIQQYCEENEIDPSSAEKSQKAAKSATKVKAEKSSKVKPPSTMELTLEAANEGLSVEQIAQKLSKAVSTVEGYIVKLVIAGKLPAHQFVTSEEQKEISSRLIEGETPSGVYAALEGRVSYMQIRLVNHILASEQGA